MRQKTLSYLLLLLLFNILPSMAFANASRSQRNFYLPSQSTIVMASNVAKMASLFEQTSTVVIARTVSARSEWNQDHSLIRTDYTFTLLDVPVQVGWSTRVPDLSAGSEIHVVIDGGYLPSEGIGLAVSHDATFAPKETVLLLLASTNQAAEAINRGQNEIDSTVEFQVAGGELGKYRIDQDMITNEALHIHVPVEQFLRELDFSMAAAGQLTALSQRFLAKRIATVEEESNPEEANSVPFDPLLIADDELPRWLETGVRLPVKVNVSSEQVNEESALAADFFMAIQHAMRTWSVIPSADFTLYYDGETSATTTGYNGENEILFIAKGRNKPLGQAQIWYTAAKTVVEVDMWLNDDYEFSIDGSPALNEVDLESVVLHELGHWVPLGHSSNVDAVMYSVIGSMEVRRVLHAEDINNVAELYACDFPPCLDPIYLSEMATPTPRPSPTSLPTPTSTFVPTVATLPTATPTPTRIQPPTGVDIVYIPYIVH